MTDLVERLRINSGWRNQQWQCVTDPALLTEAADLIEQLKAEIARKDALIEKAVQAAIDAAADAVQYCVNGYALDDIRALSASEIVKEMCGE